MRNMNIKEYAQVIDRWRKIYNVPYTYEPYDPRRVKLVCMKCGRIKIKMGRHHKANDFFFALWKPELYAKRYIEFHPDDCDKLCNTCHRNIERYSAKLKKALYDDFNRIGGVLAITQEWCEEWKVKFRELYAKWISKVPRKRKRKKHV